MALILSVIVPVYNVERYLEKCLKSILSQDIRPDFYEIILVDDGSTDNSGRICDTFASNGSNISVIHQANQGLSVARNVGLSAACGKYVLFVDSDDFLQQNVFGVLVDAIEEANLDILRFKYTRIKEGDQPSSVVSRSLTKGVFKGHDFLVHRFGNECYACQFMIRKELLTTNGLYFRPGIIFEDTEWTPRVLEKAQRVSEIDLLVYYYLVREGSITQGNAEKVINGQMTLIGLLKDQAGKMEDKQWHEGMIAHTVVSIFTTLGTSLYPQRKRYLSEIKKMNVLPLTSYNASKRARRKIEIINRFPGLACLLIKLFHK
jgi:glycosyltransferase involved in cell wall biosynthesis